MDIKEHLFASSVTNCAMIDGNTRYTYDLIRAKDLLSAQSVTNRTNRNKQCAAMSRFRTDTSFDVRFDGAMHPHVSMEHLKPVCVLYDLFAIKFAL